MDNQPRSRHFATMMLLFGAVIFGMVLAGSAGLTPAASSGPVSVEATLPAAASVAIGANGVPSFADLAEAVQPAVVSIQATSFERGRGRRGVDPFEFFFGPRRRPGQPAPEDEGERSDSGGSGFLVSADGLVVTNHHVIRDASELKVQVNDREYKATVKGTDPDTDLALLQIEAEEAFTYLSLGDSDGLRVGDWIMAIGSPLALDHTVTVGVVSAKGRSIGITDRSFENFIQTDAAINFGNSGGPLVNLRGEVVGIATAINYGAENIGFAVPVSTLKQILPQLRSEGRVSRGYLGVAIENLDYRSAQAFGLEEPNGALVYQVTPDSPAERAGLRHGDIILRADDHKVLETRDLIDYISGRGPDAEVDLTILRGGEEIREKVKLSERGEFSQIAAQPEDENRGIDWLGISYRSMTPELRSQHGAPDDLEGVWLTRVSQSSPLFEQGVRPGVVVTEVNGLATPDSRSFDEVVEAAESGSYLRIYWRAFDSQGNTTGRYAFVEVP